MQNAFVMAQRASRANRGALRAQHDAFAMAQRASSPGNRFGDVFKSVAVRLPEKFVILFLASELVKLS